MKTARILFVAGSLFAAFSSFAVEPSLEMVQVTRALMNCPDVAHQLKANSSTNLTNYEIKTSKEGVNEYRLTFTRTCRCLPETAIVKIYEDLRPTRNDGAPVYRSSVEIEDDQN
jgi:hypothetical protein